jgi:DNA polymerase-4
LPGIGPVAEQKLQAVGMRTLGDVARASPAALQRIFGAWAEHIQRTCHGQGAHELGRERPAFQEHDPAGGDIGSISNERTFREDVRDPTRLQSMLCSLCERVCWRARKRGVKARTVTLKLRYADFQTLTRGRTIAATCSELDVYPVISDIFTHARSRRTAIRLLGVCLSNLRPHEAQLCLFDRSAPLHRATDDIRQRYGYDALRVALANCQRDSRNST